MYTPVCMCVHTVGCICMYVYVLSLRTVSAFSANCTTSTAKRYILSLYLSLSDSLSRARASRYVNDFMYSCVCVCERIFPIHLYMFHVRTYIWYDRIHVSSTGAIKSFPAGEWASRAAGVHVSTMTPRIRFNTFDVPLGGLSVCGQAFNYTMQITFYIYLTIHTFMHACIHSNRSSICVSHTHIYLPLFAGIIISV